IFGDGILEALDCVTHRKDESWDDYIERVSTNQTAIRVKMADLTHNMDLSRIPHPKTDDYVRIARYKKTYDLLQSRLV
ncbi:MAG: GTP pyrophosphokinase, partial [Clostridia bacterium]|nr:GTP pyrophosphokinase [Clostridia bacterium]